MRFLPHLAIAVSLVLTASTAQAGTGRATKASTKGKAKTKHKVAPPVVEDEDEEADDDEVAGDVDADENDEDADDARATARDKRKRKAARAARDREDDDSAAREVAFEDDEDEMLTEEGETDVLAVKVRKGAAKRNRDWNLAVGPYLWASAVDADVSLGPTSISAGVDFMKMTHHAKYGIELLTELRYRKLSFQVDFMYGVVGVEGEREVGPLMVSVDGTASSLLIDGTGGYQLVGDDHSLVSIEPRGGVRYQRTAVKAVVGVAGNTIAPPESVSAGGDALAGARVFVRPHDRFYFTGSGDVGVFGVSSNTWSASVDASVRLSSRMLLSLGYRTLTQERANIALKMYGPRVAFQLLF